VTEYVLGSDDAEVARLDRQAASIAGASDALLRASGIAAGMRVLDLGTGLGHVATMVRELVGPEGAVVGVDREAPLLALAERRRTAGNVSFTQGDVRTVRFDEPFDAITLRLLLFHLPDAVDVLRHHRANLRPDGLIVVLDFDSGSARTEPPVPLADRVATWIEAGFRAAGANPHVGARLIPLLRDAGYADVTGFGIQAYLPASDPPGPPMLTGLVRALAGTIVAEGIAAEDELGLDTLEDRLRHEMQAAGAVFLPPTVVGAWGRLRS
jgi:SAM-dependent methyltransferase